MCSLRSPTVHLSYFQRASFQEMSQPIRLLEGRHDASLRFRMCARSLQTFFPPEITHNTLLHGVSHFYVISVVFLSAHTKFPVCILAL